MGRKSEVPGSVPGGSRRTRPKLGAVDDRCGQEPRHRAEHAHELGASETDARQRAADPDALSEDERRELRRLRKENAELKVNSEILQGRGVFAWETIR